MPGYLIHVSPARPICEFSGMMNEPEWACPYFVEQAKEKLAPIFLIEVGA